MSAAAAERAEGWRERRLGEQGKGRVRGAGKTRAQGSLPLPRRVVALCRGAEALELPEDVLCGERGSIAAQGLHLEPAAAAADGDVAALRVNLEHVAARSGHARGPEYAGVLEHAQRPGAAAVGVVRREPPPHPLRSNCGHAHNHAGGAQQRPARGPRLVVAESEEVDVEQGLEAGWNGVGQRYPKGNGREAPHLGVVEVCSAVPKVLQPGTVRVRGGAVACSLALLQLALKPLSLATRPLEILLVGMQAESRRVGRGWRVGAGRIQRTTWAVLVRSSPSERSGRSDSR